MANTHIILNIHGGTVQDLFCSDPNAHVQIVDWDVQEGDPNAPGTVEISAEHGRKRSAFVGGLLPNSLADLSGTDVEQALMAAEVLHGAT